jgi:N-acetylmuramoyl-L-alanine amidase
MSEKPLPSSSSPTPESDQNSVKNKPAPGLTKQSAPEAAAPVHTTMSIWRVFQSIILVSFVTATLFTLWKPANIFSSQLADQVWQVIKSQPDTQLTKTIFPTGTSSAKAIRIGIVSGHWKNDSGAVCADGTQEMEVNLSIASLVRQNLIKYGFLVDLLAEKDNRLNGYEGAALVSIHNDSCDYVNDDATGFKVAAAQSTIQKEKAARLTACLVARYQNVTKMRQHASITADMTDYHAFNEINSNTPAAIIETGFLNLDRDILLNHPDIVAQGITEGILCFIRNEPISTPVPDSTKNESSPTP